VPSRLLGVERRRKTEREWAPDQLALTRVTLGLPQDFSFRASFFIGVHLRSSVVPILPCVGS
jgi:hypothetical protein